jgi:hypothetical protein
MLTGPHDSREIPGYQQIAFEREYVNLGGEAFTPAELID